MEYIHQKLRSKEFDLQLKIFSCVLGTIFNCLVTYPLEIYQIISIQSQGKLSFQDILKSYSDSSQVIGFFYRGVVNSILRNSFYCVVYFGFYDSIIQKNEFK